MKLSAGLVMIAVLSTASFAVAMAQTYPAKPIRVIVPYPPGGTSDILTRLIGVKLTASWGQQIITDNRTGASGNIFRRGEGIASKSWPARWLTSAANDRRECTATTSVMP